MGFHKRYVDKDVVKVYLDTDKELKQLFKADAFIFMDDVASKVFQWYEKGLTDQEIKLKFEELNGKKSEETPIV
jgi:hypothetical protein